ncbi:MAG: D-alanyl-D-alanine carboxypeptidase/D-alanyl-D-alanine-endopeptidase [Psychromonas sp.]
MLKRLVCFIFFVVPVNLLADQFQDLHPLLPKGTQLSYQVFNPASNTTITKQQSETLRTPASMQKLLTATAAKLQLGEDFTYQTTLEGEFTKIKNNAHRGDIRMRFVGDPTLSRSDISTMLNALKSLNIERIKGDFIINSAHFSGYQWSNGQPWNDLGVCYTSPSNAIIVNRNCVFGNLSVNASDGKKARLFIPDHEPVDISSDVDVVTSKQKAYTFCELELTRNSGNRYHLWGCMVPRKNALALSFAINDPFQYTQQIIAAELKRQGIKLEGDIILEQTHWPQVKQEVLVLHHSPKLDELLQIMMKKSDNLIADSLFKTVGASYFNNSGNFRNGAKAVKNILEKQGIDLQNAYIADGSGLSRHNLMSADLFMSVLNYVYKNDDKLNLLSTFAVAGVDGTMKYHRGLRGDLLKGKVIAKTGSMKGVANLLGVVESKQGPRLFVLMLNGYNLTEEDARSPSSRGVKAPKYRFEQAFFEQIMNE